MSTERHRDVCAKREIRLDELMTGDTRAAGRFYSDVVGWTTREVSSGDDNKYTTFNLGDVGIAGMLNIPGHTSRSAI